MRILQPTEGDSLSKEKDLRELFHDTLQEVRAPLVAVQDKW
jgi:hypothetical protein